MIREVGRVEAPPELVRDLFADSDGWPRWMPGIRSARTLEETADGRRVEVCQSLGGRSSRHVLEVRLQGDRLRQEQVSGWPGWNATWTFRPSPRGTGTTVSLELELELGMLGVLSPRGWVQRFSKNLFRDTLEAARRRARVLAAEPEAALPAALPPHAAGEVLLTLYETPDGLEMVLDGRTYAVLPKDTGRPKDADRHPRGGR